MRPSDGICLVFSYHPTLAHEVISVPATVYITPTIGQGTSVKPGGSVEGMS